MLGAVNVHAEFLLAVCVFHDALSQLSPCWPAGSFMKVKVAGHVFLVIFCSEGHATELVSRAEHRGTAVRKRKDVKCICTPSKASLICQPNDPVQKKPKMQRN